MFERSTLAVAAMAIAAALLTGCGKPQQTSAPLPVTAMRANSNVQADMDNAVLLVSRLEYDAAVNKLTNLAAICRQSGDKARLAEALFWLGFCKEKQGTLPAAKEFYQQAVKESPKSPAAGQAHRCLDAMATGPR